MTSDEWEAVPAEIRERSFFMARVTDAEILQRFREGVEDVLSGKTGESTAEKEISFWLRDRGYKAPPGKEGTLQDLSSLDRINLVLRMNVALSRAHASWVAKQLAIRGSPCQEFIRVGERKEKRDWPTIWEEARAELSSIPGIHPTLMIALTNHPIWRRISRFGLPYPPIDFGSGMGVASVGRREALAMGFKLDPNNDPMQQPLFRSFEEAFGIAQEKV